MALKNVFLSNCPFMTVLVLYSETEPCGRYYKSNIFLHKAQKVLFLSTEKSVIRPRDNYCSPSGFHVDPFFK